MRKDIQYRDLPGGPLMVKFADELPLGTLCSRCGMLSKDMYEDPSSHAFCSICIFECSDRKKIHCKYENKDVSVDEMMPAIDIINIVMDQVVFCPNTRDDGNSCTEHCSLKDLEGHYLGCDKTEIICLSCGDPVKGVDWQRHVTSCPQQTVQCRHCIVAVPRWKLEQHERVCSYNPRAIREVPSYEAATVDSTTRSLRDSRPNEERIPASRSASGHCATPVAMPTVLRETGGVVIQSCPICNRNVKSTNMDKHLDVCLRQMHHPDPVESSETPDVPTAVPKHETDATAVPLHLRPQSQPEEYMLRGSSAPNAPPGERPDEQCQDCMVPDFSMGHFGQEGQRQRNFAMGAMEAEDYGFASGFEQLSIPDVLVPPESSVNMHGQYFGDREQGGHSHAVASGIVVAQTSRPEEAPGGRHRSSSGEPNRSSHTAYRPDGKWPQQLRQGDWGQAKMKACSRRTSPRSWRNTKDESQRESPRQMPEGLTLTLRWSHQQCLETIPYYADVIDYYDKPEGASNYDGY